MTLRMMPEQIEEYTKKFQEIDVDGKGAITAGDLGALLTKCGQKPTEEQLQLMVAEADINGDGTVDLKEFLLLMQQQGRPKDAKAEFQEAFRVFDRDGDGSISVTDLMQALGSLGEEVTEEEVREVIEQATGQKSSAKASPTLKFEHFEQMLLAGK
eukprot:TRINITY_DN33852_c0_g1_i1.p1 TRINITY_DN33852_c0_g1~~TRINITY_DN33852_c0_g1_i1.p1  ORF type:complete len:156 (+),score=63.15 TRINITY_DN33852_c0_g1_i1:75-542(+)